MNLTLKILVAALLLVIAGGAAFLLTWDIPSPSATKEIVLPDDRFPQ